MIAPLVILISFLLSGCAGSQGIDIEPMRAALHHGRAGTISEQNTAHVEAGSPPKPFRLALYFLQRDFPPHRAIQKADWVRADKSMLVNAFAVLRNEQLVTETISLEDVTVQGQDIVKIRQAARRYGADVVLLVDGLASVDRYNNLYAALYATVIGAYLAPGTESDALFMIEGSLWDVRTGRLYVTETVEGRSRSVASAAVVEDREVIAQAKKVALEEFGKRMADALRRLYGASPHSADPAR